MKCKVCGYEFPILYKDHYIARNNGKTGIAVAFGTNEEERLYDAFDCPACGCQNIIQERKRYYIPFSFNDEPDEIINKENI